MAERMRPKMWKRQSQLPPTSGDERPYLAQRAYRSADGQEHIPVNGGWAYFFEVTQHRVADLLGKRVGALWRVLKHVTKRSS